MFDAKPTKHVSDDCISIKHIISLAYDGWIEHAQQTFSFAHIKMFEGN